MKNKNLEKLFRKNKTSPLLKTPEKDFHTDQKSLVITMTTSKFMIF